MIGIPTGIHVDASDMLPLYNRKFGIPAQHSPIGAKNPAGL